jgi:hypothetical protein
VVSRIYLALSESQGSRKVHTRESGINIEKRLKTNKKLKK